MLENTSKSSQEGLKILEKLHRPRGNTICFELFERSNSCRNTQSVSYSHTSLFLPVLVIHCRAIQFKSSFQAVHSSSTGSHTLICSLSLSLCLSVCLLWSDGEQEATPNMLIRLEGSHNSRPPPPPPSFPTLHLSPPANSKPHPLLPSATEVHILEKL